MNRDLRGLNDFFQALSICPGWASRWSANQAREVLISNDGSRLSNRRLNSISAAANALSLLSKTEISIVKGLLFLCVLFLGSLGACEKASTTYFFNNPAGIYGKWTWAKSSFGPVMVFPPSDSIVTLSLNPDNSYAASLNGEILLRGTYRITVSGTGPDLLHFNNLPPTIYDTANASSGSITYGHFKIGKLILFVDEEIDLANDGLQFVQHPIHPEDYLSAFHK